MERDIALRLDAMLMAVRGNLDMVVHYMKNNLSEEEFVKYRRIVANAMAETCDISSDLHTSFPDIIPDELK